MDVYEWTDSVLVADLQFFYFFPNTEMFSERGLTLSRVANSHNSVQKDPGNLFIVTEVFTRLLPEQDRHATYVPAPPPSI